MRCIALLRGINVGGNNKVAMSELRDCFEKRGFTDVKTYINSGNIFFTSEETNTVVLVDVCESAIEERFGFTVIVTVLSKDEFEEALQHAPSWWADGSEDTRNDALLLYRPHEQKKC